METDHAEAAAEMRTATTNADGDQLATKADLSVLKAELLNRLYTVAVALAGLMIALKFFP